VGILGKESNLAEKPGPGGVLTELIGHPTDRAGIDRHLVEHREFGAHLGLTGGEQFAVVALAVDQMVGDSPQQLLARFGHGLKRKGRVDSRILGQGVEGLEHQEVAEELTHSVAVPGRGDHSLELPGNAWRAVQLAARGGIEQGVVGP
jgi:hypothetical protein